MDDLSSKTVCIVDHGLFCSIAETIAPHFKKVYYAMNTAGSFPTTPEYSIGKGIPGVTRLKDTGDALAKFDEIDLWIFPDLYMASHVSELRKRGARVWGSGKAEVMELDRLKFKKYAAAVGMDVGDEGDPEPGKNPKDYVVVKGMDAVEDFMKRYPGWFLKLGDTKSARGDFETLKSRSWREARFRLREIRRNLGHRSDVAHFILERPIKDAVEVATDIYNVDGKFPKTGLLGLEMKAECYLGKRVKYEDYPEALREVNSLMAPLYEQSKYRNLCPIECRMTEDGLAHPIDPCLRFGRPPLSVLYAISNWHEIFWEGAAGVLVEPEWRGTWAAELCLYCTYAEKNPAPIAIPEKFLPQVKLSNYCVDDGERIIVPMHYQMSGVGSVVAVGSTYKEAIANVREVADAVTGYDLKTDDSLDGSEKVIATMKDFGVQAFG